MSEGHRTYTIAEVAAMERVGINTIRREIAAGRLRAYRVSERVIRIPEAWLEEYRRHQQVGLSADGLPMNR